jgi:hypothetical protein|tara:strand:- start:517 stop:891 length:375 start_codon:yes stop_codon:yes gene_type:complete
MATPNNFKVTNAIGSTDNYAGAEVKFFHITLVEADSSALDIRTELGYDETMHNLIRTILLRGTILYQRIDDAASGRIDVSMERPGWTAATLQTAIRDMGTTVGVNNKDVSLSVVAQTELKLDNS